MKIRKSRLTSSNDRLAYRCVIGAEEALLDARPEGERDEQHLVGLAHVPEGRHQQLQSAQLLAPVVTFLLAVPSHNRKHDLL